MQEEADAQVRAHRAQQRGDQLELVVVDPDRRPRRGRRRGRLRVPLIDPPVRLELGAVVHRRGDRVVVQRPDRAVGEPLVEHLDVSGVSGTSESASPAISGGSPGSGPSPGTSDSLPDQPIHVAVAAAQGRLECADEPARRPDPPGPARRVVQPLDGQPVRDDDQRGAPPVPTVVMAPSSPIRPRSGPDRAPPSARPPPAPESARDSTEGHPGSSRSLRLPTTVHRRAPGRAGRSRMTG